MKHTITNNKNGKSFTVIVDDEHDHIIIGQTWSGVSNGHNTKYYIAKSFVTKHTQSNRSVKYLHNEIIKLMGLVKQPGQCVDHINGNSLDNRTENLRLVNRKENSYNRLGTTSKYESVYYQTSNDKYVVRLNNDGTISRKSFRTEIEAAAYYAAKMGSEELIVRKCLL